jgi:hypothetical protein
MSLSFGKAGWTPFTPRVSLPLTGWLVCMYLLLELLELSTLDTRRFLFRLPESLSRQPDHANKRASTFADNAVNDFFRGRASYSPPLFLLDLVR